MGPAEKGERQMVKIAASHTNGYVKLAMVRSEADAVAVVAMLEERGRWTNITVTPWVPTPRRVAR